MAWYRCEGGTGGGGLPYVFVKDVIVTQDSENLVIDVSDFDFSKTVIALACYDLDRSESTVYTMTSMWYLKLTTGTNFGSLATCTDYQGNDAANAGWYRGVTFDDTNKQITIVSRAERYLWRAGRTYRVLIISEES